MKNKNSLKIDERRSKILELLHQNQKVVVSELSNILGTSSVTIRNDLNELSNLGLVKRFHGGADKVETSKLIFPYVNQNKGSEVLKETLANFTSDLIQDGDTLFINSGTTTYQVAQRLRQKKNLSLVTNSINIAVLLADIPSFRVKLLGGDINNQFMFVFGNDSLDQLAKYRADKTILSVSGFSCSSYGLTTYHPEEASLDRLMMERSRETIVVADSTKYNYEGFYKVTELAHASKLVTNTDLGEDASSRIRGLGVELFLC